MWIGKGIGRIPWTLAVAALFSACAPFDGEWNLFGDDTSEICQPDRCGMVEGVDCGDCSDNGGCMSFPIPGQETPYHICNAEQRCELVECGNGIIQEGEECEAGDTLPCADRYPNVYPGGEIVCNEKYCYWDTADCIERDVCGNGVVETGENCDHEGFINCTKVFPDLYAGGTTECLWDCSDWDTEHCIEKGCGNYIHENGELCEASEKRPCVKLDPLKYTGGTSFCNDDCSGWDISTCEE